MAKPLLPDELWKRIEPLLPPPKPRRFRYPGRKPIDNRRALIGILFVLKTGIHWEDLPQELGCGSGMTCWRRLRDWHKAGVWQALHELLLAELNAADRIDWSRAAVDSSSVRALGGGEKTGPNPTDRSKPGSKHHCDHRRRRHPAGDYFDRRQRCGHWTTATLGGRDPAGTRQAGASTKPPRSGVRRSGLRLGAASPLASTPRNRSSNCTSPHTPWKRLGLLPLGRGTNVLVVSSSKEAPTSHRVARGHARSTDVAML